MHAVIVTFSYLSRSELLQNTLVSVTNAVSVGLN